MLGKKKVARSVMATLMAGTLGLGGLAPAFAATAMSRLGGASRYETMSHIVTEGFASSSWAILATGDNFPDALCASALAGARSCPVILTSGTGLTAEAKDQLTRLGVKNVYIMGGGAAVSNAVEQEVAGMGIAATRVSGNDRQQTSNQTLSAVRDAGSTSATVIVATGATFADALSIGPWAYQSASPIVLTGSDGLLAQTTVDAIKADGRIKDVLIVGGTAAVSDGVQTQLGGDYTYTRLGKANRYETSTAIADWSATHGMSWANPAIATGQNFPDALAGAALCGSKKSPLVLASASGAEAAGLLKPHAAEVGVCYVFGGAAAVSAATERAVSDALGITQAATDKTPNDNFAEFIAGWSHSWMGADDAGNLYYLMQSDDSYHSVLYIVDNATKTYRSFIGEVGAYPDDPTRLVAHDIATDRMVEMRLVYRDENRNMIFDFGEPAGEAKLALTDFEQVKHAIETIRANMSAAS